MGRPSATGPDGLRHCSLCKTRKSVEEFYVVTRTRRGITRQERHPYCKVCDKTRNAKHYFANLDSIKARNAARKDEIAAYQKQYRIENADDLRDKLYRRKYGIGLAEYNAKLEAQGGGCGICKKSGHQVKGLAVDHSHVTRAVRGILCSGCNAGIGMFLDDVIVLQAAIEYVKKWGA